MTDLENVVCKKDLRDICIILDAYPFASYSIYSSKIAAKFGKKINSYHYIVLAYMMGVRQGTIETLANVSQLKYN